MTIRRAPRPDTRFYTLNKDISEDLRLSWAARGLLIFLLGKPDHWEVSVKHLIKQTEEAVGKHSGRDAVRVIIKELEQVGYITADKARSSGRFDGMAYMVSEEASLPETDIPGPVLPETDFPGPANPHLVSNEYLTKTDSKHIGEPVGSPLGSLHAEQASASLSSDLSGDSSAATSSATSPSASSQASLSGATDAVGKPAKKTGKAKDARGVAVDVGIFDIPSWLPREKLQSFVDNRLALKKPMTVLAIELLIKELEKLSSAGHDPLESLDKSILQNWMTVYAPRSVQGQFTPQRFNPRDLANANATKVEYSSNNHPSATGGATHDQDDYIAGHAVRVD
jgi:hypothetical protein